MRKNWVTESVLFYICRWSVAKNSYLSISFKIEDTVIEKLIKVHCCIT